MFTCRGLSIQYWLKIIKAYSFPFVTWSSKTSTFLTKQGRQQGVDEEVSIPDSACLPLLHPRAPRSPPVRRSAHGTRPGCMCLEPREESEHGWAVDSWFPDRAGQDDNYYAAAGQGAATRKFPAHTKYLHVRLVHFAGPSSNTAAQSPDDRTPKSLCKEDIWGLFNSMKLW